MPIAAVSFGGAYILGHEPTGPQRCEEVQILGVVNGIRGTERFDVVSYTGQHRLVGRFDKPFAANYVGPAALFIRVGKWTGWEHYKMSHNCKKPPNDNNGSWPPP